MIIRQAISSDLDIIKGIAEACAIDMASYSIFQWNEKYPSREVFKKDIESGSLYVIEIKKNVIGSIVKEFVAMVQPITGGKAPEAPPITMF